MPLWQIHIDTTVQNCSPQAIDRVLKQRINLAKQVDTGESTLEALSLCNWDPRDAAALLALRLHLGAMAKLDGCLQPIGMNWHFKVTQWDSMKVALRVMDSSSHSDFV